MKERQGRGNKPKKKRKRRKISQTSIIFCMSMAGSSTGTKYPPIEDREIENEGRKGKENGREKSMDLLPIWGNFAKPLWILPNHFKNWFLAFVKVLEAYVTPLHSLLVHFGAKLGQKGPELAQTSIYRPKSLKTWLLTLIKGVMKWFGQNKWFGRSESVSAKSVSAKTAFRQLSLWQFFHLGNYQVTLSD